LDEQEIFDASEGVSELKACDLSGCCCYCGGGGGGGGKWSGDKAESERKVGLKGESLEKTESG
jgi:hypothetical protein